MLQNRMKKILLALTVLCFIHACAPISATRGHLIETQDIEKIEKGSTTGDQILSIFGTPSSRTLFDENVWLYIGKKTERYAFFRDKVIEQRVLLVEFDDDNIVRDYAILTAEDMEDIRYVEKITPTAGDELTIIQQLVGNIGRFQKQR